MRNTQTHNNTCYSDKTCEWAKNVLKFVVGNNKHKNKNEKENKMKMRVCSLMIEKGAKKVKRVPSIVNASLMSRAR